MIKFIVAHRVCIVEIEEMDRFRAVAAALSIKWSEVARSQKEVMVMMVDADCKKLKKHLKDEGNTELSSDGDLPTPKLQ